jgi:hypothetical protein
MCLGHRLAAVAGDIPFAPERIVVAADGAVRMQPGPVAPRWRAPEVRTSSSHTTTSELWGLGRLLLELSLGRAVDDATADHADEAALRGLFDVEGNRLPDRVVEILAVLLNPRADERLQSAKAAARVFADAEVRFGDGAAALVAVLANARRRRDEGHDDRAQPKTMALSSKDILDQGGLAAMAQQAEIERRRQQAIPVKRTEELPARAILSAEDLEKVSAAATKKQQQKQLPTQVVRRDTAPVDADFVVTPKLLGPASSPEPAAAPLVAPPEPEPSSSVLSSSSEPSSLSSSSSDELAAPQQPPQGKGRALWIAAAVVVAVVVVVVVVVASSSGSSPT